MRKTRPGNGFGEAFELLVVTLASWLRRYRSRDHRIDVVRVTGKGQVTIPKELRDELGIESGTEVVFERQGDHLIVRTVGGGRRREGGPAEGARGRGDVAMSTDEIMALTRNY